MLPNSIERTAPILGYDPYAFIMDRKSNLNGLSPAVRGGGLDYFAKKPENMYTNGEKVKNKFSLNLIIKGVLTIGAFVAGGAALVWGKKKIATAPPLPKTTPTGGPKEFFSKIRNGISNGTKGAGGFISDKFHAAGDFLKRKFHRP